MTNEPTNIDRAAWAKEALTIFTVRTYSGDQPDTMHRGDLETAISDLIADLLHYASQQRFDASMVMALARNSFQADLLDPAGPDIDGLLAPHRQVAVVWSIEDVLSVRPHLTLDQAWEVLLRCRDKHDSEWGFTWSFIEAIADDLFPSSDTIEKEAAV